MINNLSKMPRTIDVGMGVPGSTASSTSGPALDSPPPSTWSPNVLVGGLGTSGSGGVVGSTTDSAVKALSDAGLSPETALALLMLERYESISKSVTARMADLKARGAEANELRGLMNQVREFRGDLKEAKALTPQQQHVLDLLAERFGVMKNDDKRDALWSKDEMDSLMDSAQNRLDTMTSDDQMAMQLLMRSYQKMDECVSAMSTRSKAWHESAQAIIRNG